MGKYAPLKSFLIEQGRDQVPMTFAEIEKVLDLRLPASKQYPAWWSNHPGNNPMTREWLDAGYETESVNIAGERLVFRRVRKKTPSSSPVPAGTRDTSGRHPGFGFMKGLIKIENGFDVAKPFDNEPWDEGDLGTENRSE